MVEERENFDSTEDAPDRTKAPEDERVKKMRRIVALKTQIAMAEQRLQKDRERLAAMERE